MIFEFLCMHDFSVIPTKIGVVQGTLIPSGLSERSSCRDQHVQPPVLGNVRSNCHSVLVHEFGALIDLDGSGPVGLTTY